MTGSCAGWWSRASARSATRAIPALDAALDDDDPNLRGRAIAALRAVGGARAAAAIGAALHEDPDPNIRRMAARALGRMDHDAALAALEAAQTDPDENVRASVEAASPAPPTRRDGLRQPRRADISGRLKRLGGDGETSDPIGFAHPGSIGGHAQQ